MDDNESDSFFMYEREDEQLLLPLFQNVDSLIDDFASQMQEHFSKDRIKRYLGAHVCYEHHTKFIREFKPLKSSKNNLYGHSIFLRKNSQGKKIPKSERKAHQQKLRAQWKSLNANERRTYELEAKLEKKNNSQMGMLAKYKSFAKHWKQFRKSADFFRDNYRTHLMIYRVTDTVHDKLYISLLQPDSGTVYLTCGQIL